MRGLYSSKTKIRHQIFTEIARLAYEGDIEKEMMIFRTKFFQERLQHIVTVFFWRELS